MQARIGGRRAAPPRPTLLVGDLEACHAAFGRLQSRVLELSLKQQAVLEEAEGNKAADPWRDLVPLCRALRETLTSLRELSHFTREVYECAADVCTRAGDFPEALKALQTLVNAIYPALAAAQAAEATLANGSGGPRSAGEQRQEQRQQRAAASAPVAWADDECEEEGDEAWLGGPAAPLDDAVVVAALRQHRFRRWPEAAGALALYFDCCSPPAGAAAQQSGRGLDTLATLRRLPPRLLASPEVRAALRLRAALAAGDYVSLFRLAAAAPPLTAALVARGAATRERERALRVLAVAYRNIAVSAVCGVLALHAPRQLLACLKLLADRGHVAAQRALGGLQQEDAAALATADLVFKG
ncbi:leukocyte receptor cluster member 8-like protein [Micractinium conductrix]|uniref:Leukocyte receptor cluster member 8-like protein n=1 Tax=Micractinium conductrix TaxID=554055 RepID=A0A2P6V7R7_9CHLO|nr:leukocyte receptor cluster member 8-like protein [Micractinium conductrix]|eukprot:PSC70123.1 leukocyte receptor cluster member 8-like protein [Micractinium conductrix]